MEGFVELIPANFLLARREAAGSDVSEGGGGGGGGGSRAFESGFWEGPALALLEDAKISMKVSMDPEKKNVSVQNILGVITKKKKKVPPPHTTVSNLGRNMSHGS